MRANQAIEVMHKYGKSFYWASFFLGKKHTYNAAVLYEFCRFLDDLADGNEKNKAERLNEIATAIASNKDLSKPCIRNFLTLSKNNDISVQPALELISGMQMDQTVFELKTERELLRYSHAVAGTVGVMMCKLLGCKENDAYAFAVDLGIAMQLTNIARDVLEDANMGRRYIPEEWLSSSISVTEIAIGKSDIKKTIADAIKNLLTLSEQYYISAFAGIKFLPLRSRLAIIIALRIYREIGIKLTKKQYNWWEGRTIVTRRAKLLLTIRSIGDLFFLKSRKHDESLHIHLKGLSGVDCSTF